MDKNLTKYWSKQYKIDLKVKKLGAVFYNEFKDVLDSLNKTTMGIEIVLDKEYTFKTFILWANKLRKLNAINDARINQFFELLETNNNDTEPKIIDTINEPYSEAQEIVFHLANKNIEMLKQLLINCVEAEKECFKQFIKNNPTEEAGNCLWRIRDVLKPILEEIDRCEPIDGSKPVKLPKTSKKPKASSLAEPLKQVKELI